VFVVKTKLAKVLGYHYRVEFKPVVTLEGEEQRGLCHSDTQLIEVSSNLPKDQQREVLLHELIHAIEYGVGISLTEAQVTRLARAQLAVFKDNLDLAAFIALGDDLR
jgi:hypothetical protein